MSSITNIPYSAKSMNGIIVLSDGTATIEDGNMTTTGNISGTNFTGTTINATTLNTTDTNITGTIDLKPVATAITINNYNFATPSQSLNNFTQYTSPYSSITGWTISLASGTAPALYVGRGFTALVNTYETLFPEYPLFIQYLSFQGASIYQMNVTQSLSFPSTGNYILTMYVWGMYNQYSVTNNVSITCGNGSITNFTAVEQAWTKIVMKFQITTAGANTLTISVKNTNGDSSGLSISGIQIVKQSGLVVYDGTNTNNQLITTKGLYTNGFIYNKGSIQNFGPLQNYGPLSLILPYSSGSLVIGSSSYGSSNTSDTGRYNVLIGSSNVVSSPSLAVNLDSCVFIGYAAGEQGQNSVRNHGIGYQSNRWGGSASCYDNVGYGYQSNSSLGYSAGTNAQNTTIGNFALSGGFAGNNIANTTIGYNSLSGADFTNGRSYNSICGAECLQNILSNYNSSLGYGNANSILNLGSNYNTFVGAQVCTNQSGAANVLLNCTFLGSTSNVYAAGNFSNSTCVGFGSLINGNNRIILGRSTETTFAMGGLNIPASTVLTLLGTITANSLSVTPTQVGYLNALTAGIVSLAGNQTVGGIKTFSSPPVMSGASITSGTIGQTQVSNGYVNLSGNQTVGGIKTFSSPPVMSGASIAIDTIPLTSVQYTFRNTLYNYGYGENALSGIGPLADNNSGFGSAAVGGGGIGTTGRSNSGFGATSLYQVEGGSFNSACGSASLYGVKAGSYNCALGSTVAYSTDGSYNVFIGYNCATDPFNNNIYNDNCTLVGNNTYAPDQSEYRTVIGSNATADLGFVGDNSIVLGRDNLDSTFVMKDLYLRASIRLLPTGTEVPTAKLEWLATVNTASNLSITNPKVIINTSELSYINTTGTTNLEIGNSTSSTKVNGPLLVANNSQKINGYITLSGSPNNLTKPLSEYYNLTTASTGALTLPVIDADMYGSQVTFLKQSTNAIWTINAGTGNTFRLYKSNSTATTTSISMAYNFTVLRIVATQSTVWDVMVTDIFYEAAANWVVGTQYFPMLMNPTNITAATDWNSTLPTAFYGQQGFSITATVNITLPLSTNVNVPDGLRIKFRRVGGTAQILNATASTGDTIFANNALTATAAGTAVPLVAAAAFWGEIYLNKTTKVWYCQ
jgi:hypothetical protein